MVRRPEIENLSGEEPGPEIPDGYIGYSDIPFLVKPHLVDTIIDPISAISSLAGSIISRIWPDKSASDQQKFTLELTRELQASNLLQKYLDADMKQTEVNLEQAKSSDLFVSGVRPAIMWGLGAILVIYFALTTGCSFATALGYHVIAMPPIDPTLRDIILGLLGLGYITRSYDKKNGKG